MVGFTPGAALRPASLPADRVHSNGDRESQAEADLRRRSGRPGHHLREADLQDGSAHARREHAIRSRISSGRPAADHRTKRHAAIARQGQSSPSPINGTPKPHVQQDGGFLDVTVHPQYAKNGWIYLSYSEVQPGYVAPPPPPPADPAAAPAATPPAAVPARSGRQRGCRLPRPAQDLAAVRAAGAADRRSRRPTP